MKAPTNNSGPWLAYRMPSDTALMRLFCFPYAGAGASIFLPWTKALPDWVDVCPVQLPGREARIRETAHVRLQPLVESACLGLLEYLDRPFCFFGHSIGGLLAFEIARKLRRISDRRPELLMVSGCVAPHIPNRSKLRHDLPRDEMLELLGALGGTPPEVLSSPELMQIMLPILCADLEICDTHTHTQEMPIASPILACGGASDPLTPREDLEQWRGHTQAAFELHLLPGSHFFIHSAMSELLDIVKDGLSRLKDGIS